MKTNCMVAVLGALASAAAFAALPDKAYIIDYWTPPVDMVPAQPIDRYTLNTRVPEYFWLNYDGANTLALRIRPIEKAKVEKEIEVGLILTNRNPGALGFDLAREKGAESRQVGIYGLDLDATEFCGVSFMARAKARNAADSLQLQVNGKGFGDTLVTTAKTNANFIVKPAKDGFVSYTKLFKPKAGGRISRLAFTVGEATAADFEQVYEIIDFRLLRPEPKARFEDLPPRTWVKKDSQEPTGDIFEYVRGAGAADTIAALPKTYEIRPQLEKEKDSGYTVEYVTAKVGGRELPAVKITLVKGDRCLLRFPIAFDGLDYNTMTFAGKVEVFDGAKPTLGDVKPMLWGTNQYELNKPFDTFQVSFFSATDDFCDWTRWGLAQADYCQNKDLSCALSKDKDGWRAFAYDIANSDPSNNKSSFYTKLTHWCFYYNNKKIPEGKKVVVTIADPRLTKGVMLTGGDPEKYAKFLKEHDPKNVVDFDAMETALEPPKEHRLAEPIPFIRNRVPVGRICLALWATDFPRGTSIEGQKSYTKIVRDAAEEFSTFLTRKYSLAKDIPIDTKGIDPKKPPKGAIVVGGTAFAKLGAEQKAIYDADMKALAKKPGFAIRAFGGSIYIYAPADYNYAGAARGLAFGLYELLENNTDLIWTHPARESRWAPMWPNRIFEPAETGDFDLVWGDGFVYAPPVPEGCMEGLGQNRVPGFNWAGDWQFGRRRTRSTNHWFGYGTDPLPGEDKEKVKEATWGRRVDGTLMKPGCYTGHPCLVRVLDRAREDYLRSSGFNQLSRGPFAETQAPGKAFAWNSFDVNGLWVEDSISMCQCEKCLTPIRLANGTTVGPDSPYFRSTQFYSNGSAMINAVNVYARRDARVESIGYFWMAPVPLMTVSRNYVVRFCPYIRKNYFVPIFAPMNDMHWRAMNAWGQQGIHLSLYEYFLEIRLRPFADVAAWDFDAEVELGGFDEWQAETEHSPLSRLERWTMERMIWGAYGKDIPKLRAYYLKRTFREAAEPMAKFYSLVMGLTESKLRFASPMEFEDNQIVYRNAMRTKADGLFAGTVADELEKCVCEAEKAVKNPFAAQAVREFREEWDKYKAEALDTEAKWLEDLKGGAASKEMKIVGAPE